MDQFRTTSFRFVCTYMLMYVGIFISLAVLASDVYTTVVLLAYNRWSSSIDPAVPIRISKWIFTGCIILSFLLLIYDFIVAIRIARKRNISRTYINQNARNMYSVKRYNYFCLFGQITTQRSKTEYLILFVYFTLKGWLKLIFAEAPRQVINALTLYSVLKINEASLLDTLKKIANTSKVEIVVISAMAFSLLVWAINMIALIFSLACAIPLYISLKETCSGLEEYCYVRINDRIAELVKVYHLRDLEDLKEANRKLKQQPTLPMIFLEKKDYLSSFPQKPTGAYIQTTRDTETEASTFVIPPAGMMYYDENTNTQQPGRHISVRGNFEGQRIRQLRRSLAQKRDDIDTNTLAYQPDTEKENWWTARPISRMGSMRGLTQQRLKMLSPIYSSTGPPSCPPISNSRVENFPQQQNSVTFNNEPRFIPRDQGIREQLASYRYPLDPSATRSSTAPPRVFQQLRRLSSGAGPITRPSTSQAILQRGGDMESPLLGRNYFEEPSPNMRYETLRGPMGSGSRIKRTSGSTFNWANSGHQGQPKEYLQNSSSSVAQFNRSEPSLSRFVDYDHVAHKKPSGSSLQDDAASLNSKTSDMYYATELASRLEHGSVHLSGSSGSLGNNPIERNHGSSSNLHHSGDRNTEMVLNSNSAPYLKSDQAVEGNARTLDCKGNLIEGVKTNTHRHERLWNTSHRLMSHPLRASVFSSGASDLSSQSGETRRTGSDEGSMLQSEVLTGSSQHMPSGQDSQKRHNEELLRQRSCSSSVYSSNPSGSSDGADIMQAQYITANMKRLPSLPRRIDIPVRNASHRMRNMSDPERFMFNPRKVRTTEDDKGSNPNDQ